LIKSTCSTVSEARAAAPGEYISRSFPEFSRAPSLDPATQIDCRDVDDYACPVARAPTGEASGRSVTSFVSRCLVVMVLT
jgi:hypothetical protein